jgi:serine/threonine protein kinase
LGCGASGCVRKAIHKPSKKVMALKEVRLQNDATAREAIISELTLLQRCDHPNILKMYGAFLTEQGVSIALEYMNAGSLASIITKISKIPEQTIGVITVQLLRGLEYLHK